jgi:hypothetical protein
VDLPEAAARFHRAVEHCDNLVEVHRRAGSGGQGRRYIEVSVNRAVIVLAIATWQAVAQDLASVLLDASMPPRSHASYGVASLLAGRVKTEIGAFATPNPENARKLLQGAGYDPRPSWTWKTGKFGHTVLGPAQIEVQLRGWLSVRHAIAHGHEGMPAVDVLQAVAPNSPFRADPPIRLVDAKNCLYFVRRLTQVTADGVAAHLGVPTQAFKS